MDNVSQVFYRKWRPRRFEEVVGQEHVVDTLKKAVKLNRVAHAFLFAGPRGVGKTSTARILAKALNCLHQEDGEADNKCENCVAVEQNRMIDLVEIDAASNRGIDSIRGLRESTTFQPVTGSWKIYIIDEVHMLTEEAFNALLKTLEEPPRGVILILATTDAHKVPATIISRCQRFDFQRLSNEVIMKRLQDLCEAEKITCQQIVLVMIVAASWGSLRDAENTLEQLALACGDQEITEQAATKLLGIGNRQASIGLAEALIAKNVNSALMHVNAEVERGISPQAIQKGTIEVLRAALLMGAGVQRLYENDPAMVKLAKSISPQHVKRSLAHILETLSGIRFKGEMLPSVPLELAVFKVCVMPEIAITKAPAPTTAAIQPPPPARPKAEVAPPQTTYPETIAPVEQTPRAPVTEASQKFQKLCNTLKRPPHNSSRMAHILYNVEPPTPRDGVLYLRFKSKSIYEKFQEVAKVNNNGQILRTVVDEIYGSGLKMKALLKNEPTDNNEAQKDSPVQNETDSEMVRHLLAIGSTVVARETTESQN